MLRHLRNLGRAHKRGNLAGIEMPGNNPGEVPWGLGQLGEGGGRYFGGQDIGGLGDIDMSSIVVSQSGLDQETISFDGRLNAWLLDFAAAAARLPPSFVAQVDAFVTAWRAQKDSFYIFQTSRLGDIVRSEGDFNRLRAQFLGYGQSTGVGPATVTANGKSVGADQIPANADWFSKLEGSVKWVGIALVVGVAYKVSSDVGLFKKIGGLL